MRDARPAQPPTRWRRRYIVQRRFQFKYIAWVLLLCLLVGWVVGGIVYTTVIHELGSRITQVYPQARAVGIIQTAQLTLVRNLIWLIPVLVLVSVWLSHKIAGPLIRIKHLVDGIGQGAMPPAPIRLRRHDELQDLAASLNAMTERLRARTTGQQAAATAARDTATQLTRALSGSPDDLAEARRLLDTLQRQLRQLNSPPTS